MKGRLRLNHTYTAKNGWQASDDTVEVEFDDDEYNSETFIEDVGVVLVELKEELFVIGQAVAIDRNDRIATGTIQGPPDGTRTTMSRQWTKG